MSHASSVTNQQDQTAYVWSSIGVIRFKDPVRFKCGHKGTLGTVRMRLCADCRLSEKKQQQRRDWR